MCEYMGLCPECLPDEPCEPCVSGGFCVPVSEECLSDADCPPGFVCELYPDCVDWDGDGIIDDCFGGGVCVPVEEGCLSNADCPEGWLCELTYCECPEEPDGECYCVGGGVCVPPVPCWVDADCDDGDPETYDYCRGTETCYGDPVPSVPECIHTVGENCEDAIDNDEDGLVDMDDPDCMAFPC
jgi:Cys-rich repeat protein